MTTSLTRNRMSPTLLQQALMDQQQKIEVGKRIWELRENSAETNGSIAAHCGVNERTVAGWVAGNGLRYENAEKVAELFGVDVDSIWRGPKPETPDLMGVLSSPEGKLDLILQNQGSILHALMELSAAVAEIQAPAPIDQPRRKMPPAEHG